MSLFSENIDTKWFKSCLSNKNLTSKIENIKLLILDIDGSLTDGFLYLTPDNKDPISKKFSVQDGFAINEAIKNNLLKIAFLSGRRDNVTKVRAEMLGIPDDLCLIGFLNKAEKIKQIQKNLGLLQEQTLIFGDDFLDYKAIDCAEIFCCPSNAPFYIQHAADIILPKNPDNNAFRLLIDFILFVQKKHFAQELITKSLYD